MMMNAASLALLGLIATVQFGTASAQLRNLGGPDNSAAAAPSSPDPDDVPPEDLEPPSPPESLISMQFTKDPHGHRDRMEMIRSGELGLAAIRFGPNSFAGDDDGPYAAVHGEFCIFDPSLIRTDPSNYPTIAAVMSESDHCAEHSYTMPLREIVLALAVVSAGDARELPVSGLLFHEGHSGAGLVSNALATFDSAVVVSEHPALRDALGACDVVRNRYTSTDCSPSKQRMLVRDVITLMSRTADPSARRMYLKVPSASAAYLPELRSLYPDAPWAFVYRKAEDALAKATARRQNDCVKSRRNPSAALSAKASELGLDLETLSHHEVCALHLSMLLDVAAGEHDGTGTGMLISYDNEILSNVNAIVDVILPYFGLEEEIDSDRQVVVDRVSKILSLRSDTRRRRKPEDKQWNSDGDNIEVTEEVSDAIKTFMGKVMDSPG